jgi:hypothetical protein
MKGKTAMASNDHRGSLVHGIQVLAGSMLIIGGAFQAIQSIAALVNDQYLLVLPDYIFSVDLTDWDGYTSSSARLWRR